MTEHLGCCTRRIGQECIRRVQLPGDHPPPGRDTIQKLQEEPEKGGGGGGRKQPRAMTHSQSQTDATSVEAAAGSQQKFR